MPSLSGASTVLGSTLFLDCSCNQVCNAFNDQTAGQQIWQSFAAARHFCSAKILAGGLRWGWGPRRSRQRHRAKKFPEEICFAPSRVCQICRTPTSNYSKVRNNARLVTCPCRVAPGCQRDRGPFCFGKRPEEPLPRGSFGQLLRGGSTPRFFSQIRSVGSKPTRLAGYCQSTSGPWTTEYQSPGASLRGFCVIPQSHSLQDFSAYQYRSLFAARYNTQTAADSPRPATAGTSVPCRAQS